MLYQTHLRQRGYGASFNNEYNTMRNKMTMIYWFTCLLWTPRLSPRSIMYSVFGVAGFGVLVKWMWWNVNRDYLWYICKSLSVLVGVKSVNLALGLSWELKVQAKDDWRDDIICTKFATLLLIHSNTYQWYSFHNSHCLICRLHRGTSR